MSSAGQVTPDRADTRSWLVRLGGLLAAGLGVVALAGWALDLPTLAGLGAARVPMAPSTALLFVLLGIATAVRNGPGAAPRGAVIAVAFATVTAALLLVLSLRGIHLPAEHLGLQIAGSVGEVPLGHMSPVTALCFLLASLSYLASARCWPAAWRAVASGCAGLLIAASVVLVFAYLLGSPLFYAGGFIPPAATTSLAFAALGLALLGLGAPPGHTSGFPRRLALVFLVLGGGIVVLGGLHFRGVARRYRIQVGQELMAVAELKAGDLETWREERRIDAALIGGNAGFRDMVGRLLADPQDAAARAGAGTWLATVAGQQRYDLITLLDARGNCLLAVPEGGSPISPAIASRAREVLASGRAAFQDFYRDSTGVHLGLLVPILDDAGRPLGVVVLRIDPGAYLYPFLQRWPSASRTAETLLVRREGDDALFLNELRFEKHAALALRLPLTNLQLPAARAVLGAEGVVEGRDYRGVPVLAAVRSVPGSPWYLVARIDRAEVDEPLRDQLWIMSFLVGTLLAAVAGGLTLLWREQRLRDLGERYQAERERAWLHDVIARSRNEVYVFDPGTLRFRFANRGACLNLGRSLEELAALTPLDVQPELTAERLQELLAPLRGPDRPVRVFQTVHRRKDGSVYPAEVHVQLVDSGAGDVFLAIVDDITERRRAEARIQQLNRVHALLSDVNQAIVRVREPQALFAEACRIAVEVGGFSMAWIGRRDRKPGEALGQVVRGGATPPELPEAEAAALLSAVSGGSHHVCNDVEREGDSPWRDVALARGHRARAVFPLLVQGELVGALALHAATAGHFDAAELALLDEVAMDLSLALEVARLEEVGLRLSTAIDQSPVSVYVTGVEGRIEYVNSAFTRITGYSAEEALGQSPRLLRSGKQDPALYRELWTTISAGRSWQGELVNRRKDGSLYTQELTIAPVRTAAGQVTHFVAIGHDVTERKLAEAALRSSEERYRAVTRSAHEAIVIADRDGNIVGWNLGAQEIFGHPEADILGRPLTELMPERHRAAHRAGLERVGSGGSEHSIGKVLELEGLRRDGSEVPIELSLASWETAEGRFFTGMIRDITERRRAEQALLAEKTFSETMLDSLPVVLALFDAEGRLLRWNRTAETVLGYSPGEIAGMRAVELFAEEDRTAVGKALAQVFETGRAELEASLAARDGASTPYHFLGVRAVLDGEVRGVGTGIDITTRRQVEAQLRQAQKIEAIGQLAGGVAHDFNNILGVIAGHGELALRQLPAEMPVRSRVEQILRAAERAAALTRQLLAFSRKQVLQPRLLDLNAVLDDAHRLLDRLLGEDVEVRLCPAPDLGTVRADPGQLEQVVLNLAVNARDAMSGGGTLVLETGNVELDAAYAATHPPLVPGRYVMLAVSDTGTGMDRETQQRIFEPFFTTKAEGQGTGLGLATVYGIVKQSGGYIWVYSEPGQGTTFRVYLPRVDALPEVPDAAAAARAKPRGQETILLVEDTEALREVIRETLEEDGYTVLLADDGEAALAIARQHLGPIHLLLTDVVMPKLGGGELARLVQALRPATRVLYMSGYTQGAISRRGVLEQGALLLEKPFSGDQLAAAVRDALDRPAPPGARC